MKILVSGGHLTPALALIDYVQKNHPEDTVVFVGRLYSQDTTKQVSQEKNEIDQRHLPFIQFQSPRLTAHQPFVSLALLPFKLIHAIFQALSILNRQKPNVFLSFGGYLAVPLAMAAWLKGIPIVTHEQTRAAGFANQLIARLAKKVAITYQESAQFFPDHKVVLTGNPLRQEVLVEVSTLPTWVKKQPTKPILLITCGNQGSHRINEIIGEILPQLVEDWVVVHMVGNPTKQFDDLELLTQKKALLPTDLQDDYYLRRWVSGSDLSWLYTHAQTAVARSGANTVQELAVRHIPTLFIPLPFSHRHEQLLNAQALAHRQAALILTQDEMTNETLFNSIRQLQSMQGILRTHLRQLDIPINADEQLYKILAKLDTNAA